MKGFMSLVFGLMLASCDHGEKLNSGGSRFEECIGKKIDFLIKDHGSPDQIAPSNMYSMKFDGSTTAIVLTYKKDGKLVYIAEDCVVIGVFPVKE